MSEELRKYIYNNLNQKKTDELVEIWQKNDRIEWTDEAFAVIQEILLDRLGELPPQAEPILHKQEPAKPINRKFLWVIPIALGIVGFLLAPKLWGFTSTWQKIGKPADKIEKIIGVTSGTPRLIVQTDNGETYSLDLSRETSWVKVENLTWAIEPTHTVDVFYRPPPFRIKEIVRTFYVIAPDCAPDLQVGLSQEGEVWIWEFAAYCGLIPGGILTAYCLVPIGGLLLGALLVWLGLALSNILAKRKQSSVVFPTEL